MSAAPSSRLSKTNRTTPSRRKSYASAHILQPPSISPKRAQRVAVLRAVKGLAARRPDLGIKGVRGEFAGRGCPMTFFNRYRVLSYAMARLKGDNLHWRHIHTRMWRSEAELRAELAPGGRHHELVTPGGAWLRHTEMETAKRNGDHAALERLEAEQERIMGSVGKRIQTALAKIEGAAP